MFGKCRENYMLPMFDVLKILEVVHCQFDLLRHTKASLFTIQSWRISLQHVLAGMWNAKGVVAVLTMNRSACRSLWYSNAEWPDCCVSPERGS